MTQTRFKLIMIFSTSLLLTNTVPFLVSELPGNRHVFRCAELKLIHFMKTGTSSCETMMCCSGHVPETLKACMVFYTCKLLLMQIFLE